MVKHLSSISCGKTVISRLPYEISRRWSPWLASFLASSGWRSAPPTRGCRLCLYSEV